ncbi:MAG TPA: hypothetical protein DCF87_06840 [Opitutae bacterium]|nr:hypothetical protein [Opitutae bacterium]|tara:strand:- start:1224 stop:1454 length:231 start_codon:yes stop_codon:yes gene_type:complete
MKLLKYAGLFLIGIRLLGWGVTVVDYISLVSQESAKEREKSISGTLGPATLGSLSILIGLILIFLVWICIKKSTPN